MNPDYLAQYRAAVTSEQCAWDAVRHLVPDTADLHGHTWTAWWAAVHRCDDLHGPHGLLGPASVTRDHALSVPADIHQSVQQTLCLGLLADSPSQSGQTTAGHRSGEGLASIITNLSAPAAGTEDAKPGSPGAEAAEPGS